MQPSPRYFAPDERLFLHDLAGQVAICQLLIGLIENEVEPAKILKLKNSLDAIQSLIKIRRQDATVHSTNST